MEPGEPTNYFQLAKIYEDAGAYDEAEKVFQQAKQAKPSDPAVYMQLAGYYNRQGQFDKTIQALEERAAKEPNNPDAFYTISTYYWDKAYRDFKLNEKEKRDFVQKGVEAVDRAIQIRPDYMEALVYKNLLLRLQANMEKDTSKQQALLKEADRLRDKAQELRKQKAAGVSD
jgi:tetratricopeptide (TPR) repeat protein